MCSFDGDHRDHSQMGRNVINVIIPMFSQRNKNHNYSHVSVHQK